MGENKKDAPSDNPERVTERKSALPAAPNILDQTLLEGNPQGSSPVVVSRAIPKSYWSRHKLPITLVTAWCLIFGGVLAWILIYNHSITAQFGYLRSVQVPSDMSVVYNQDSTQTFPLVIFDGLDAPASTHNAVFLKYKKQMSIADAAKEVTDTLAKQNIKKLYDHLTGYNYYQTYTYHAVYVVPKEVGHCSYLILESNRYKHEEDITATTPPAGYDYTNQLNLFCSDIPNAGDG